jgi:hypothetical protein
MNPDILINVFFGALALFSIALFLAFYFTFREDLRD